MSAPLWPEPLAERLPFGHAGPFYGLYPALVSDIKDPESQGRVRVRLPFSPDSGEQAYDVWARLATLMAGAERGSWFIPDVDDEVLVGFLGGDPRYPVVVGALWNGRDAPPETMDSGGDNHIKTLRTRSGVVIRINDAPGSSSLTLETPGGHSVVLDDGEGSITVADSNGNTTTHNSSGVTVDAASKVTINAGTVEVSAGQVTVNAGMSQFSGVVKASCVIADSVVGTSYTPGAGNIW